MDTPAGEPVDEIEIPLETVIAGKYALGRELGRGGNGVVYEATNTWTHRRVAIKLLAPGVSRSIRVRFFREARVAARLTHPNIVDVLDMGEAEDGSLFIVQELLEGVTLEQHLQARVVLAPDEVKTIFLPIADALALAHDHGVVHRDVKPSNVLLGVGPSGQLVPKLLDFGIATDATERAYTRLTTEGSLVGTPLYMAPEQIADRPDLDGRADVWGIAVCVVEALTGRLPFRSTRLHELLREIVKFDPDVEGAIGPIPEPLAGVLRDALRPDVSARTPSMRTFHAALSLALQHGESSTDLTPVGTRALLDDEDPTETIRDSRVLRELRRMITEPPPAPVSRELARPLQLGLVLTAKDVRTDGFADAFAGTLGRRADVLRFASYAELVDAVGEGDVDLAWLPPVAYLRARRMGAAELLVTVERGGASSYASAVLARRAVVRDVADVRGKRAVWVDGWSAAGYLVPRSLLRHHGIEPDSELRAQGFVGSYDAVLDSLASGAADLGGCFCNLDESGFVVRAPWRHLDAVRVIAVSETIPGDTFCASRTLEPGVRARLMRVLLSPESAAPLLRMVGASSFVAGDSSRYDALDAALVSER